MSRQSDTSAESKFQNDIIEEMLATGWQLGSPKGYDRGRALYTEDLIGFVKDTQDAESDRFGV